MTNEQKKFVEKIAPIIIAECTARGYKFPSAIIGQAVIEGRYGTSVLAKKYHNHFGMKAGRYWKGKTVNLTTGEQKQTGERYNVKSDFRVYDSDVEGIKGYFDFINTKRYSNLKDAITPLDYLQKLKADGYATSLSYVSTVWSIASQLSMYDKVGTPELDTIESNRIDQLARQVIAGKLGNGVTRKNLLGSDYTAVQQRVNEILNK